MEWLGILTVWRGRDGDELVAFQNSEMTLPEMVEEIARQLELPDSEPVSKVVLRRHEDDD